MNASPKKPSLLRGAPSIISSKYMYLMGLLVVAIALMAATLVLLDMSASGTLNILGFTVGMEAAYGLGVLTLILLALMNRQQFRDAQLRLAESERRQQETEDQNRRNQ